MYNKNKLGFTVVLLIFCMIGSSCSKSESMFVRNETYLGVVYHAYYSCIPEITFYEEDSFQYIIYSNKYITGRYCIEDDRCYLLVEKNYTGLENEIWDDFYFQIISDTEIIAKKNIDGYIRAGSRYNTLDNIENKNEGNSSVVVAIIDTGIDYKHEKLVDPFLHLKSSIKLKKVNFLHSKLVVVPVLA